MDKNHPSSEESRSKIELLKSESKDKPTLRGFDRKKKIESINGALNLRKQIENILDKV